MSLTVRNPKNDEDYRIQQEFFKKYPNAGKYDDMSDFYSRGVSSFTKEKLKDYKESGLLSVYESYKKQKQYRSKKGEYEITNAEKDETPDFISKWNGVHQRYDLIPAKEQLPKSEYTSLKLGRDDLDREVFVDMSNRNKEIEMTLEDYQSLDGDFFELPKEYSKSLKNKWEHYHECYIHDKWCAHRKDKRLLKRLNKELNRGVELTQAESDLNNISIFDTVVDGGYVSEVVHETNSQLFTVPPKFTEELQHRIELGDMFIKVNPTSIEVNGDRYVFEGISTPNPNLPKNKKEERLDTIHKRARTLMEQLHDEEKRQSLAKVDEKFANNKQFVNEYFETKKQIRSEETILSKVVDVKSIRNHRMQETLSYKPKTNTTMKPYENVNDFHIKRFNTPFVARNLSQL